MLTPANTSPQRRFWPAGIIVSIAALFYCFEFVLRILPGALQSEISQVFGNLSATAFGTLSAFYYLAYSPMQLPVGVLMDRFGPHKLLTFACICCTLGSFMFADTTSLLMASYGRFLVGFGSAFAFVGVLTLAAHWLPKHYFSLVAGLITTLSMLGVVYGEMKITALVASWGLPFVLSFMAILGAILTIVIFLFVKDASKERQEHAWKDFLAEVWQVLAAKEIWWIGIIGAFLYTSLSIFGELWGKGYLECAHHLTKLEAAKTVSAVFLGWALGAPLVGYFSDASGWRERLLLLGAFCSFVCISLVLYYPSLSPLALMILLFFYGFCSSAEIIIFIMAKERSQAKLSATVFAAINMIVTLGGVLFQPLVGALLDLAKSQDASYSRFDYQIALSILPLSMLIVVLLLLVGRKN